MKGKLPLLISLVLGVFAILAVYKLMEQQRKKQITTVVRVAIAKQGIPKGTLLKRHLFDFYELPQPIYRRLEDAVISEHEVEDYMGKARIQQDVEAGRFLLRSHFQGTMGSRVSGLMRLLSKGKRAMSIGVSFVEGVAGLLQPGNKVDVLGIFKIKIKGWGDYSFSVLLLQDKEVLALDSYSYYTFTEEGKKYTKYGAVTLRLDQSEMALMAYAATRAEALYIALRNRDDREIVTDIQSFDFYEFVEKYRLWIRKHPIIQDRLRFK